MAGVAGLSGRPKTEATNYKETHDLIKLNTPAIAQVMIDKALEGDMKAGEYLLDRVYGKPKQAIETKSSLELTISPDFQELLRARQRDLIEEQQRFLVDGEFHEVKD